MKEIIITNAKQNNLKNISLKIPRNSIALITGVSGSGKSSLAFDTIYAESQRRYMESLSSYAKQFIDIVKKPEVESIEGLSPSIAINQKSIIKNPRSTVGTITEIYDHLRLLYTKTGIAYCYKCKEKITSKSIEQIVSECLDFPQETKLSILSPIIRGKKGEYTKLISKLIEDGYTKILLDGITTDLSSDVKIIKNKEHDLDLYIDRLIIKEGVKTRLKAAIENALKLSSGLVRIKTDNFEKVISSHLSCLNCNISYQDIEPRIFSFNSPKGACPTCHGLGYLEDKKCPDCLGLRLKKESLSIKTQDKSIMELASLTIENLKIFIQNLLLDSNKISEKIIKEIQIRLDFLIDIGLGYLTLDRSSYTLSGGEAQRIRLGTQLGSGLTGILYIMDEPSIGLHPRDNRKLINAIKALKEKGNSIIIVEHDEETIREADYIIDLGIGSGTHGGSIVAEGALNSIIANEKSLTGKYLGFIKKINTPSIRKKSKDFIEFSNIDTNNLKNINIKIPKSIITCITGVSGSGKSSLVFDTLFKVTKKYLDKNTDKKEIEILRKKYDIKGLDNIENIIDIDQSPIGKTPRSNPATYTGLFIHIRNLFTSVPEARARGYKNSNFSFNVAGGRCDNCEGAGFIKIDLKFMPDVFVKCEKCNGLRFSKDTLDIKYKDKNIAQILDMTIEEALVFFKNIKYIYQKLKLIDDVGLGYIKLGQAANTLSGGEAQRIKITKELLKRSNGKNVYILDEPTTGLHFEDIEKLIKTLQKLNEEGNTIIMVEHNLDIVKIADYIIDLGPDAGENGGEIIAEGSPEEIIKNEKSITGKFLKEKLRSI